MEAFADGISVASAAGSERDRPRSANQTGQAPPAERALQRARERLLELQHPDGWWKGELQTNVTMDAEDMLLRQFLGVRDPGETVHTAEWIRSQQRPDGSWANFWCGPGELSTTLEAYVALRLAGDPPGADHMRTASAFVRESGGIERARVFTHIWLALFDVWPWQRVPVLPPELMLLAPWVPLNVYDFACWARQTIVALSVVLTYRPRRPLPFELSELRGYRLDHPAMKRGLEGLQAFTIEDGQRRLEACQSPVWDTALAVVALADAGLAGDDPALIRAAEWLLGEQAIGRGDWAVRRPRLSPGGWAFEFANVNYPDVDDAAEVALALGRVQHPQPERVRDAIERAAGWVAGMQSRNGGWGAFDADNCRTLVRHLPFCDFGEVTDPPSADVTAHAVEMLAQLSLVDLTSTHPLRSVSGLAVERGRRWLLRSQEADGSWYGRWGVNHIYGTGAAVPALVAAGVGRFHPSIRRAVRWLEFHQNDDGGWGEDPRSYDTSEWVGRGVSTASQTAWALLALDAAGERSPAVERGVRWLVETQRHDGSWDEPQFTGTGFPSDFYINYHLYRLVFPITALGRCVRPTAAGISSPVNGRAQDGQERFAVAGILVGHRTDRRLRTISSFARLVHDMGDEPAGCRPALLVRASRHDQLVTRYDLSGDCARPALRALLALQVENTRTVLDQGAPLARQLPPRARIAVAGLVASSRDTLDALQRADYDVLGGLVPRQRRGLVSVFAAAVMGR